MRSTGEEADNREATVKEIDGMRLKLRVTLREGSVQRGRRHVAQQGLQAASYVGMKTVEKRLNTKS
jgi:hypothetical protein